MTPGSLRRGHHLLVLHLLLDAVAGAHVLHRSVVDRLLERGAAAALDRLHELLHVCTSCRIGCSPAFTSFWGYTPVPSLKKNEYIYIYYYPLVNFSSFFHDMTFIYVYRGCKGGRAAGKLFLRNIYVLLDRDLTHMLR